MSDHMIGASVAVLTSLLWSFNAVFFTIAGKRIGAISVNVYRIVLAVALLAITHLILLGTFLPMATSEQWFWIGMSGIIGLGIGDFGLFAAFVIIGPRKSLLMMALSPIFASFTALALIGETLSILAIVGIAVTISGVMLVIFERKDDVPEMNYSYSMKKLGVGLALVGAVGQGIGAAFVKKGMLLYPEAVSIEASFNLGLSATLMRMVAGMIFVLIVVLAMGKFPELRKAMKDRKGMKFTALGGFVGPYIGVTLATIAILMVATGVAQTLISLMPLFIIPIIWFMHKQKTSARGIAGAVIAVIGVAMLFLLN